MKNIAYRAIFGETWGSGHLNRAIAFAGNVSNPVHLYVVFERDSDRVFADRYGVSYTECTPQTKLGTYDLLIDDTLGLFAGIGSAALETWVIDGLHAPLELGDGSISRWSVLYPSSGRAFPTPEIFFKRTSPCAAIFQGGADDHRQIEAILAALPRDHDVLIGIGSNCRHVGRLREQCALRGKASVLVDFDVTRIARSADYVVTSGGNILFQLLYKAEARNLILYSKEAKEHLTFRQFADLPSVVRYFEPDTAFVYEDCFVGHVASSTTMRNPGSGIVLA